MKNIVHCDLHNNTNIINLKKSMTPHTDHYELGSTALAS